MSARPFMRALVMAASLCAGAGAAQASEASNAQLFKRLDALAPRGNAEVAYHLGMFLNNGLGTARDGKAALQRFQQAADAGHLLAAYKVGCYHAGQFPGVVPVDREQALKYKLRAAEGGYDLAQQDVGIHHAKTGNKAQGLVWFERAAAQGDVPSTAYLAEHYAAETSADKVKGLALMLLLKQRATQVPPQVEERIAAFQAALTAEQRAEAVRQQAAFANQPTPLTLQARGGMAQVRGLLASLE